jgi:GT2 family glycosyltransferase
VNRRKAPSADSVCRPSTIELVPTLSAIVPATNDPPTLARCRAAIREADDPPEEVIVVETADEPGPAAARNEGARRAQGDVLVFVDADVVPHADAFTRVRAAFARDPSLTAIFGSYDDDPAEPGVVSAFRNLLHHHVHQEGAGAASTFWAGLGAVRRDAFLAAGGFDALRYPLPSVEDIELGLRLAAGGARIELDPELQATHLKRWTFGDMVRTDFSRRGVPWATLMLERGGAPSSLNLGWRHRLSALAAIGGLAAVLGRRPKGAALAGVALVGLNAGFYGLLVRRRGPLAGALGIALHAVHHWTGTAAAATALVRARSGSRDERAASPELRGDARLGSRPGSP